MNILSPSLLSIDFTHIAEDAIHILQKNVDIMRFVGYNNQGRADARFVKVRAGTQSPAASTLEVILRHRNRSEDPSR